MKQHLLFAIAFLIFNNYNAQNPSPIKSKKQKSISFTENKGQIGDQYYHNRTDVLFGGSVSDMDFFIKNSGVSYQLKKVESYKDEFDQKQNIVVKEINEISIYRIDLNWKNCNPNINVVKNNEREGVNNFYSALCPNGVFHVKSYNDVILKNIYNNIDLHYYEKNGNLKYDYIVAPNTNYKQIQIEIKGAEINLQKNGSILLRTPFGEIEEGAPLVFQNGITLKSEWVLTDNILSFEIKNYDPSFALLIDPATRVWGTYFGGSSNDFSEYCSTDSTGCVYTTGQAQSSNLIATIGAYQTTLNGSSDAYLAKFSPTGALKWGTYYGGTSGESPYACKSDAVGNVYMVGNTNSANTSSLLIATVGAHQTFFAGGSDGFIVKFDSTGVRQWGTYYGGFSFETVYSCATDPSGNIYIAGVTDCSCTAIATPGAHQTILSGQSDCFLAKFNSSGTRLWATYYGGTLNEQVGNCTTDGLGNVYLAGATASPGGTIIATPGSHQPAFVSTFTINFNAFLTKFNSAGVRQWGTYYGGNGGARAWASVSDKIGNVVISGDVQVATSTAVATPGCAQSIYGGGSQDAFIARFNPSGQRQWGTYYGGSGDERVVACAMDTTGNVYVCGSTTSSTGISTLGSHQTIYAGAQDGFLAKYDVTGSRQFGTYYGAASADYGEGCAADKNGNVFLSGYAVSSTGTTIATPGSYQAVASNSCDAYVVKFNLCSGNTFTASYTPTLACTNQTVKVTAGGVNSYTILPDNISFTSTVIITPTATTVYTINGAVTGCSNNTSITLTVNTTPSPTITVASPTICNGVNYTFTPSGAVTYTYMNFGPIVAPIVNTTYTISGTAANGCISKTTTTISLYPLPTLTVNSGAICPGQSFTINPSGALSYTFSSGSPIVSPTVTTSYFVTGSDANGCVNSPPAVSNVTVGAIPVITVNSGSICTGQPFIMFPNGANSFTYTPAGPVVFPTVNSTYTITGASSIGCLSASFAVCSVTVNPNPTITVNSGSICSGQAFTIVPGGASTYTFTGGGAVVSPTINTSYSVTGTSSLGCDGLSPAVSNVTVLLTPTITVASNSSTICVGESATLTASGAASYTWGSGGTNANEVVTPTVTTNYNVTGTGPNGCTSTMFISQIVDPCTGIIAHGLNSNANIHIYPNPNNGEFMIDLNGVQGKISLEVYNAIGQIVLRRELIGLNNSMNISNLANGIYHVNLYKDNSLIMESKIVKE